MSDDIGLDAARELVRRAVDKAEQLGISGAIAVVGASGALVTASRMDEGGAGGLGRARSKAWIAATQKIPSTEHLHRMNTLPPAIAAGFVAVSPEAAFPGAGGMPVRDDAAESSARSRRRERPSRRSSRPSWTAATRSSTASPPTPRTRSSPTHSTCPTSASTATTRRAGRRGTATGRTRTRRGSGPVPAASGQPRLDRAVALADRVLATGQPVAVVVVDRRGEVVHVAAADAAPTAATYVAEGVAAAAALFGRPSGEVADLVAATQHVLPVPVVALAGGVPLPDGGALGVAGPDPEVCAQLAAEALA